jgi:hypothetical protein
MFQLSKDEWENLTFQNGISSSRYQNDNLTSQIAISSWGGRRTPPYAFTEQGVAMLSSVLKSKRAIAINIEIMKTFVAMRKSLLSTSRDIDFAQLKKTLLLYMDRTDKRLKGHDKILQEIIILLGGMSKQEEEKEVKRIGFRKD